VIVRELLRGQTLQALTRSSPRPPSGVRPVLLHRQRLTLDISAFATAAGILRTGLFCVLMLLVRGAPALPLYRRRLDARSCCALALLSSTQLPLLLATTALTTAAGRHEPLDRRRPGRRGAPLHPRLPAGRPAPAPPARPAHPWRDEVQERAYDPHTIPLLEALDLPSGASCLAVAARAG
jgi:hypothetical protein